ncbi:MAG TPA: DUF4157 domain-containing protein, partial [Cyclobacteriaceae bacterium]|nr:DUF4157 domain-containing protein [Cyclobacteriaceae bacterium]
MEPRFGVDFSDVRVHTGNDAVQMNRAVGAQAFTHGSDVYFGEGRSPNNLELTAHELTHVVQQTGGGIQAKSIVSDPVDLMEMLANGVPDEKAPSERGQDPVIQLMCSKCKKEEMQRRSMKDESPDSHLVSRQASRVHTSSKPTMTSLTGQGKTIGCSTCESPTNSIMRRPGESVRDCYNRKRASFGLENDLTSIVFMACGLGGVIATIIAAIGTAPAAGSGGPPAGVLVAAGCMAVALGGKIGLHAACLWDCATSQREES